MKRCCCVIACLAALLSGVATAAPNRESAATPPAPVAPAVEPTAPSTIDEVIGALYAGVSGDAGARRDWQAFARLFVDGARLTNTRSTGTGSVAGDVLDVARFAALNTRLFAGRGFHENEVHREVSQFGGVAHVWSVYETRRNPGEAPYARGANSLQLLHTAAGWRILSVTWDRESPDQPLPASFPALAPQGHAAAAAGAGP